MWTAFHVDGSATAVTTVTVAAESEASSTPFAARNVVAREQRVREE
jgi:hypothetical protein